MLGGLGERGFLRGRGRYVEHGSVRFSEKRFMSEFSYTVQIVIFVGLGFRFQGVYTLHDHVMICPTPGMLSLYALQCRNRVVTT